MKKSIMILMVLMISMSYADIIPETVYDALKFKPIRYSIMENELLPIHCLVVAATGYVTNKYTVPLVQKYFGYTINKDKIEKWYLVGMVCFELQQLADNNGDPREVYGSWEKWAWDSAGDVVFPWLLLRAILYAEPKKGLTINYNPLFNQFQLTWSLK